MIIRGGRLQQARYQDKLPYVTDNLVMFLDAGDHASYPGAGSVWYDISGNGYDSAIQSGMSYSTDNGGIFNFDGTSNAYAEVPAGFNYDYSAGLTVNVWAKFSSTSAGIWERLIDFGNGNPQNNIIIARNYDGNNIVMDIEGLNDSVLTPGEMPITWNGWAMYTILADGTYWKQYKNGQFYSYENNGLLPAWTTRYYNYIGRSNWSGDGYYSGAISAVQVYTRALTEPEILEDYNYFKGRYGL